MTHVQPGKISTLALGVCLLAILVACSPKSTIPQASSDAAAPPVPPGLPNATSASAEPSSQTPSPNPQSSPPPLTINREAGTIDLAARMVHTRPDWLELIATTDGPNSRDHEAIVTLTAKPSEIHLALLTLGLKPGHPMINKHVDGQFRPDPPTGPHVQVFFVYEIDGQTVQTPAHQWARDQATGRALPETPWLFAGSQFRRWQGKEYYMADENGNAISLVNFGDDLIVRQTDTTQNNDEQQLQLNEAEALPYNTPLTLRIQVTPAPPVKADSSTAPQPSPPPSDKPDLK